MFTIKTFRYVALTEATSWLLLIVAVYFKHFQDKPEGVSILGPIHGMLFLAYVGLVLVLRTPARWGGRTTLLILVGAVLPFGGYVVDRWLAKSETPATV